MSDTVFSLVDEWLHEEQNRGRVRRMKDIEVYCGEDTYDELLDHLGPPDEGEERRIRGMSDDYQIPPIQTTIGRGTTKNLDQFNETEVGIATRHGKLLLVFDPSLDNNELLLLNRGEVYEERSEDLMPLIRNASAIRKFKVGGYIDDSETEIGVECDHCGRIEDFYVKGDKGEIYCSLECLYESTHD